MEEKRDTLEPSNPRRQRELDAAIEKHFGELKRLLGEQREDLEHLRTAGGSTEPPADPDITFLLRHWRALPENIRRQIISLAKASGVGEADNISTIREEPR